MIPQSLRTWFIVHFIVDLFFGLPLIFVPQFVFDLFGLTMGDSLAPRVVGAAFFAIGTASLVMRNAGIESYRTMLIFKLIWSTSALVGILLAILHGTPRIACLPFAIFVVFWSVWIWYHRKLGEAPVV
jgi:flagellar biosynthesis component FlhA